MKSSLPVKSALRHRGLDVDVVCPVCMAGEESVLHIFKGCDFARLTWAVSPFSDSIINCCTDTCSDWVTQVRRRIDVDEFCLLL